MYYCSVFFTCSALKCPFGTNKLKDEDEVQLYRPQVCHAAELLSAKLTDNLPNSNRRLYVGLKAIHINHAVFFALLQMPWRNRRFLSV